jgi:superfamily II DNA or RNA helicase
VRFRLLTAQNNLVIDPPTEDIYRLLKPVLTMEVVNRFYARGPEVESHPTVDHFELFYWDFKNRLVTGIGFYQKISVILEAAGHTVELVAVGPPRRPESLITDWDRIFNIPGFELRPGQLEALVEFDAYYKAGLPGRFDCATGWGKTLIFSLIARLYPKARIHIASKSVPVLAERIMPELRQFVPDVGMYGGGHKQKGHRIQLYTFDSLPNSDFDCDILLCDESQQAGANVAAECLARYIGSCNYGFSATHDMRLDEKDLRVESLFGPVVFKVGYQEAADAGLVVPIEVHWGDVRLDDDPIAGIVHPVERKRWAYWRNEPRNRIIAADAVKYPDKQVLITCETIDHALGLKKFLPEFPLVYSANSITSDRKRRLYRAGLWPAAGLKPMTDERLTALSSAFAGGRLRKAIVTTVWNVGVSMNYLEVLLRADGGASPINDTQIPGRTSRTNTAIDKKVSIIHDYLDQFSVGPRNRASGRRSNYHKNGWTQYNPDGTVWSPRAVQQVVRRRKLPDAAVPPKQQDLFEPEIQ